MRFRGLILSLLVCGTIGCRSHQRQASRPAPPSAVEPAAPPPPCPQQTWETVGYSIKERPLRATTIGQGPFRIYLIGGIHGNEPEGRPAAARLADGKTPGLDSATLRILEDANPDGSATRSRSNAHAIDLNRNWPASNFGRRGRPLSEPETAAIHRDIESFHPDLIIVFHSIADGPFVNFDGPASRLAEDFARAAARTDPRWRVIPQMGYPTPGSMGSYFGIDRKLPILTIEFKRGQDPDYATDAVLAGLRSLVQIEAAQVNLLPNRDANDCIVCAECGAAWEGPD